MVDPVTDEIKWESDWMKNLILNQGMNQIATNFVANSTLYGVAGTGSRPNFILGAAEAMDFFRKFLLQLDT